MTSQSKLPQFSFIHKIVFKNGPHTFHAFAAFDALEWSCGVLVCCGKRKRIGAHVR